MLNVRLLFVATVTVLFCKANGWATLSVPPLIVVGPENVLEAARESVPAPNFARPPPPPRLEAKLTALPLVSILATWPETIAATADETSWVLPAAHCSVPPLNVILFAASGMAPAVKFNVPPERKVPPL